MEITICEPSAEKVLDTCVGVDNRRYYKIQWQSTWAPEEEILAKYENLVQEFWKDTESNEIAAGRSFINTLFEKLNDPEGTEPPAKKTKENEEETSTENQKVNEEVVNYNIQSFYKEVNSPEHKIADEPPAPDTKSGKPPPLWPWDQQTSTENRPYKCDECPRSYATEKKLKDHKRKLHMNLGTYQCSICPKVFPTKRNLQNHMNRHTGVGPHACPGCAKRFMTPQEVDNHKRGCNSLVEKDFQCEICSKRFATKTHLAFHMKIHLPDEEKPFKCQYCPRTFAYNHDCVHHMRLHIGDKPFKCDQCDAAFHRKSYLTEHMFVHTGISKYRCEECLEYFKTQQMLQTHVKNIHILKKVPLTPEEKAQRKARSKKTIKYKCEECGKEFRFMKEFHFHQVINHKEAVMKKKDMEYSEFEPTMVYKCKKCDKTFVWPSALKKHAETHRFEDIVDRQVAEQAEMNSDKNAAEKVAGETEATTSEDKENKSIEGESNEITEEQADDAGKKIVVVFTEEKDDNQRVVISVEAADSELIPENATEVQLEEVVSPEDDNSFTCGYCYSQFGNEFSLNVHMLQEHHKHRLTEQEQQLLQEMAEVEKTNLEAAIVQTSADEAAETMEIEEGVVEEVGTEADISTADQQLQDNISSAETLLELNNAESNVASAETLLELNNAEAPNIDYIEQL